MTAADRIPVITVADDRLKTTSICLAVAYGSRHDPPGRGGLAHVLEHMLMSAHVGGASPLVQHIERLGGSSNAETGLEQMLFFAQVDAMDADSVLDLLLRGALTPELDADNLDTERTAILQELAAAEADPADVVQDAFLAEIFSGHPLGRPVGGTVSEITAMDLDGVTRGHREDFLTSPMALAVVGPRLPAGLPAVGPVAPTAAAPRVTVPLGAFEPAADPRWPGEFGWLVLGGRSTARGDTGRHRFTLLANLLGAHASSVLYRELRVAAGLAYTFQAWDRGYAESGAWRVMIGIESGNGPQVTAIVRRELEKLAVTGPGAEDLDAARRHARMSLLRDIETPLEHARLLASRALTQPHVWDLEEELRQISAVTAGEVRDAAAHLLADLVAVVRPEAR